MKHLKILIAFFALSAALMAQNGKVYPKTNIKKGVLKNGLTYYIYQNPASRGTVNFYLLQNVGAILEEDTQDGLAHFLEHMCFNGTANFPGTTIMDKFKAKSLEPNINAFTGVDQTVYQFVNIPSNDRAFNDECLFIMYDWCNNITLAPEKIEAERPVILEEIRTRNDLSFRVREATAMSDYNGTKYAHRNIGGAPEVISSFKHQELIDFYHTWYRTDLQSIIVIGDIDPIETEQKVVNLFSTLPAKENPRERYHIDIPDNEEAFFTEVRDPEMVSQAVRITWRHPYQPNMEDNFMSVMLNNMLSRRVHKMLKDDKDKEINPQPTFKSITSSYSPIVQGYANYMLNVGYTTGNAQKALNVAMGFQKDIQQNGFTQDEFDFMVEAMRDGYERMKNAKGAIPNNYVYESIKKNFINHTDIVDAATELKVFNKFVETLTPEDMKQLFVKWNSGPNKSIVVLGGMEDTLLSKQEVLEIEQNCKPYAVIPEVKKGTEEDNEKNLESADLKGSPVVDKEKITEFLAEKWTLENGATVIYKECNVNPDLINVYASSPGGLSVLNGVDQINGSIFSHFVPALGIKGFTPEEYEQLLKANHVNGFPKIAQSNEEYMMACNYTGIETGFQLMYSHFVSPYFYEDKFDELYLKLGKSMAEAKVTHQTMLSDTIGRLRYGNQYFSADSLWYSNISLETLSKVYKDRFQDIGNFTFYIVGGIGKGKAKKLAEQYIGSIPSTGRDEETQTLQNYLKNERLQKTYRFQIPGNKAGIIYNIDMPADYNYKNKVAITVISDYLQTQLNAEIRQKHRGTYGVRVTPKMERYSTKNCNFKVAFECDPERAVELDNILHNKMVALCNEGINQDSYDIVKKKFDKPQGPPLKNNGYYINILKDFVELNQNNDVDNHLKQTLDEMDTDYLNAFMKTMLENGAVLDIIYLPEV